MILEEHIHSMSSPEAWKSLLEREQNFEVSWWGERLVSINGYQGTVEVCDLVCKYLSAACRPETPPQERLAYAEHWDSVRDLYKKSDPVIDRAPVWKWVVAVREYNPLHPMTYETPRSRIEEQENDREDSLFWFSRAAFNNIIQNKGP